MSQVLISYVVRRRKITHKGSLMGVQHTWLRPLFYGKLDMWGKIPGRILCWGNKGDINAFACLTWTWKCVLKVTPKFSFYSSRDTHKQVHRKHTWSQPKETPSLATDKHVTDTMEILSGPPWSGHCFLPQSPSFHPPFLSALKTDKEQEPNG